MYSRINHSILEYPYLNAEDLNSNWDIMNCPVALEKSVSPRKIMHVTCPLRLMS